MRAFVVTVAESAAELAADRLWQLGVRAVEERPGAAGTVELWTVVGDDDGAIGRAAAALDDRWRWRTEELSDDWPEHWRAHAAPMPIGSRLLILPAWLSGEVGASETTATDRVPVIVEPGAAFGLGDHPTTALSLAAIERELERVPSAGVLDVGCGTGVLAIAALLLGAPVARAIDIAGAAVEATRRNAERNGVASRLTVDSTPVADLDGEYDLVVANILAPALVAMAGDLQRLTAPAGRLVVSGVLADAHDHVIAALDPMQVVDTATDDGWAAVSLAHR